MLAGYFEHCLDDKNRIRIPAKLRADLGDDFVFCGGIGKNRCLYVMTQEQFKVYLKAFDDIDRFDSDGQFALSDFASKYWEPEIDGQGRITLPKHLLEFAGIDKQLVTIGSIFKVEIWSKEVYEAEKAKSDPIQMAKIIAGRNAAKLDI
ncbi:MAG: cell division/cell wall cluster transcriptional repressor MraZ [Clostridia bacterium]|nr:cell division/cell wall cluster transcriptional repressor MraZ [Clostridia bacterium]